MEQAAKFAESTQILMNVSEFTDVSQATDTLISSVQAFGYTAETSMEVVDLLNTIGNNYAISTADLAQSLTKSSASLVAAGGDLAEAAALTATANAIIQDAESVGTALKTTSLRLRGTDVKVLEEEGVDSDGAVASKSKLQSKVKALSGVDILTETGDYKSTYEILSQIADVWEDISNMDQAALLELLAGKRNASVLAAILQSPEELKEAYEDAQDSAGSAWEENAKYLDSIQGKIDQFNNAMQTLWSNLLDDDIVKNLVEWVTKIIKSLDTTEGQILAIVKAVALLMAYKKVNPFDWGKNIKGLYNTIKSTEGGVLQFVKSLFGIAPAMKAVTAETIANTLATQTNDAVKTKQIMTEMGLSGATGTLSAAQKEQAATAILNAMSTGQLTIAQGNAMLAMLGYAGATVAADGSLKVLDGTTKSFMASNPIGWILLIVSALISVVMWLSNTKSEIDKLGEELSDIKSKISDTESEIDSLNSELQTTRDRIAELEAMPSLSFIDQEELYKLKETTEELEKQKTMQEALLKSQQDTEIQKKREYIDRVWNSNGVDKAYDGAAGFIEKDVWYRSGEDTKVLLDRAISTYQRYQESIDRTKNAIDNWDNYTEYEKYVESSRYNPNGDPVSEDTFNAFKWNYVTTIHSKEKMEENLKQDEKLLAQTLDGITLVLKDEQFNDLEYGMSDDIDVFLDEWYGYQLKLQEIQGMSGKSTTINDMFDISSTSEMQQLGKELQEIADSNLPDDQKSDKIKKRIDQIDKTSQAYHRLKIAMEVVGVTAQDISDYFILETGGFNSNTIEGVANQYQHMEGIINSLKNMSDNKFTFNDVEYDLNDFLLKDEEGKFKAEADKFSTLLIGIDNDARQTFINIVESAANAAGDLSKIDWDKALKELNFSGFNKTFELLNNEFESLNNEMFANIADDISGLIDTVNELQAALEDVSNTMNLLNTAEEQMANSNQISVKTALDLMAVTDDYNKVVTVENGVLRLAKGAQDHLTKAKFESIRVQLEAAATLAENTYQTALASNAELDYADNASVVMTAESIKAEAIGRVSAVIVALGAAMDAIEKKEYGSIFSSFNSTYKSATATVVAQSNAMKTSIAELERDAKNKRALADVYSFADDYESFKNNYDFDKTPGDKYNDSASDAFQKEMDYWENRIAANQAKYEQIQNEIDLLEKKGQKADASYYKEQAELEKQRLELLNGKKQAAQAYLDTLTEGSEEWWEVANILNDLESEIDDVTASLVDLQDAIGEIDTYKFEEFNNRLDNLINKLGTIRDLIAPDGEEDWFDDEGNWTEAGVAVLGSHVQEFEMYKQGYKDTMDELAKYESPYAGNEDHYASLGIHSEQEYYDKVEELTDQQYDYAESISDTKQTIVDMYESQIDAVEEYIETLIDGYNDYIDSVKEALDAERDLYEFKKNVQKQSKDIAELERKIASLSGSTNKSEIAERRKLEAQLYEAREGLNDTYYDHAKDVQNDALDAEQSAYEETMNKFIEGMRQSLETATQDMDTFLGNVTTMVSLNAGAILEQYQQTELPLDDALTNPWEAAKEAVGNYSGDALELMNTWAQNGFLTTFPETIKSSLKSPWEAGQTAVGAFKTSVDNQMKNVVSAIETNVQKASEKLSGLYKQIKDTEEAGSGLLGNGYTPTYTPDTTVHQDYPEDPAYVKLRGLMQTSKEMILGPKSFVDENTETINGIEYYRDSKTGYYYKISDLNPKRKYDGGRSTGWAIPKGTWFYTKNAKGTVGTKRDEWGITDEPQFGDELVLIPTPQGNLSYMRKGTGVVPADLTANLMEWGQFTPDSLNLGGSVNVNMINNAVNKPEFNFAFDSLVKAENITEETLPAVKKLVTQELNRFTKELNYALKGKGAR